MPPKGGMKRRRLNQEDGEAHFENLINAAEETVQQTKNRSNTAVGHFNDMLKHAVKDGNINFDTCEPALLTPEIFGKFPSYLKDVAKISECGTCLGYVSSMKMRIERDKPTAKIFRNSQSYKNLRKQVQRDYIKKAGEDKKELTSAKDALTPEHHEYICEVLFKKDTRESLRDRKMLAYMWPVFGRIGELRPIQWSDLRYKGSGDRLCCFVLRFVRWKTSLIQKLHLFIHAKSFAACIAHSTGTCLIVDGSISDQFFEGFPENEARYLNRLLETLFNEWDAQEREAFNNRDPDAPNIFDDDDVDVDDDQRMRKYTTGCYRHGAAEAASLAATSFVMIIKLND